MKILIGILAAAVACFAIAAVIFIGATLAVAIGSAL